MLFQKLVVLGDIPVVEIGDAKIEKDVEKEGEIKNNKIKTVLLGTYNVLNAPVDAKYPKGLNQQIKKKDQD
jgi:hypothetical protein